MKVTDHIINANGKTLFSFEIVPPQKGQNIQDLYNNVDPLMEFNPPFIDVTTSREEFVYIKKENGLLEQKITRMRPGTVGICSALKYKYDVDAIPHVICGGFTQEETEYMLVDCHYLGLDNIMALRGDAMKGEQYYVPTEGGHSYAAGLVKQIKNLNNGKYLHDIVEAKYKSDFCIGVAGYPEKHFEAPSLKTDLKHLKRKIDAGGDYIVTQMFFDNQKYFDFINSCKNIGIEVPIVPGLKPITKKYQLNAIPRNFYLEIPDDLIKEIQRAKTDEAVKEVGIEWCTQQAKELKKAGVPCIHFYMMSDKEVVKKICENIM